MKKLLISIFAIAIITTTTTGCWIESTDVEPEPIQAEAPIEDKIEDAVSVNANVITEENYLDFVEVVDTWVNEDYTYYDSDYNEIKGKFCQFSLLNKLELSKNDKLQIARILEASDEYIEVTIDFYNDYPEDTMEQLSARDKRIYLRNSQIYIFEGSDLITLTDEEYLNN